MLGLETDINYRGGSSGSGNLGFGAANNMSGYFGTVRGRLGYAWGPALLYVTGGFAWANVKDDFTEYNTDGSVYGLANGSNNASGWTVGGGTEYMFAPRWSLKTEYMYTSLGSHTVDISNAYYGGDGSVGYLYGKYPHNLNVFRSGINYHF